MTHADDTIDSTFAHSYECERLTETPRATQPHYYYPGASPRGGGDGILIEVRPQNGQMWLGTFAFGRLTAQAVSGLFTTPDPERFCVVSKGEGCIVSAANPTEWEAVRATPIIDVRSVRAQGIIVFANFTELVAYGPAGIKWRTKRLTWDSLKIIEVTDTSIKGEFWDMRSETIANFVVDLETGTHQGGIKEI